MRAHIQLQLLEHAVVVVDEAAEVAVDVNLRVARLHLQLERAVQHVAATAVVSAAAVDRIWIAVAVPVAVSPPERIPHEPRVGVVVVRRVVARIVAAVWRPARPLNSRSHGCTIAACTAGGGGGAACAGGGDGCAALSCVDATAGPAAARKAAAVRTRTRVVTIMVWLRRVRSGPAANAGRPASY